MHRFLHAALIAIALVLGSSAHAAEITRIDINRSASLDGANALTLTTANATSDTCDNDGRTILRVKNSSGANAYTVTVAAQRTVDGATVTGPTLDVALSADRLFGPFPTNTFNNGDQEIVFTYSGTAPATDLTVACYRLPAN